MPIISFRPQNATPDIEWNTYWDALAALKDTVERAWGAETFQEADAGVKEIELIETSLAIAVRGRRHD
jgi:hypothetical protein